MLRELERIAIEAGKLISYDRLTALNVWQKPDGSPVTNVDEAAEELILRELHKLDRNVPVLAEESGRSGGFDTSSHDRFFLVDPLDGTKEFVRGETDYTVNICLVENRRPKLGVVFAPARRELFSSDGSKSYMCRLYQDVSICERSLVRTSSPSSRLTAVVSASHPNIETDEFLGKLPISKTISVGSSLKFCLIATSEADIYPRLGRTMQWDTAAGDAVLRGAGGCTLTCDGEELEYGLKRITTFDNPHFVSFGGSPEILRAWLEAFRSRRSGLGHPAVTTNATTNLQGEDA